MAIMFNPMWSHDIHIFRMTNRRHYLNWSHINLSHILSICLFDIADLVLEYVVTTRNFLRALNVCSREAKQYGLYRTGIMHCLVHCAGEGRER